jgi:hypothetical protein
VYGAPEYSTDAISVLDPKTAVTTRIMPPFVDAKNPPPFSWTQSVMQPSPSWGEEIIFTSRTSPHSMMMDGKGRIWVTSAIRTAPNPDFCKAGSSHPSAKLVPMAQSPRQMSMYDPSTKQWTPIDLCFGTHHVEIDDNDRLWFSTLGQTLGWFDIRVWDQTHDVAKAQGWVPFILDTNGNGKADAYVDANAQIDPTKDKRLGFSTYGISPNPVDGSVWIVPNSANNGALYRVALGSNPPETALTEVYEVPYDAPGLPIHGAGTRGVSVDRNGIVWAGLGTGQIASFDRRKCKVLNGPTATGKHCPEGWTLYQQPGPNFKGVKEPGNADANYYTFVDKFNTSGLGDNVPFTVGNNSDSLKALMPDGKTVVLRVPYPLGFHAKHMDGRIDDEKAGWKGRGVWSEFGGQAMWHSEGGKGKVNTVLQIQVRPNPLAK